MSTDIITLMKDKEVATNKFLPSKKEIQTSSKEFANEIVDSGEFNLKELFAQAVRLKEAFTVIESTLKSKLPEENFEDFGLKGTYRSGGDTINFKEDETYLELDAKLKKRKEQLTLAYKQKEEMMIDGKYVPLVSSTPRKSSLAISF